MKNTTVTRIQAVKIAGSRLSILDAGGEVLLPSGAELAVQSDGTYLLKGYAWDGSDIDCYL